MKRSSVFFVSEAGTGDIRVLPLQLSLKLVLSITVNKRDT